VAARGGICNYIGFEAVTHRVFKDVRRDVAQTDSRPILSRLYRRAGYLITLTYSPSGKGCAAKTFQRPYEPSTRADTMVQLSGSITPRRILSSGL
jgi:hypothetical protein